MNKQEAIEKIEACKSPFISEDDTIFNYGLDKALSIIKQLDEPEKPVVPKFVADWYEDNKYFFECNLYEFFVDFNEGKLQGDLNKWFADNNNKPIETLVKMKLFGYEVEHEQQYVVAIPDDGRNGFIQLWKNKKGRLFFNFENKISYGKVYLLTEQEIKQEDERLWQFAKEVEE